MKKQHLVWPSCTRTGPLRTMQSIRDISSDIANYDEDGSEELTREEMKGITGTSPFLSVLSNFDIIEHIPAEYMHSTCLGVIKRLSLIHI